MPGAQSTAEEVITATGANLTGKNIVVTGASSGIGANREAKSIYFLFLCRQYPKSSKRKRKASFSQPYMHGRPADNNYMVRNG